MKTPPHITPVSTSVQPGMRAALLQQGIAFQHGDGLAHGILRARKAIGLHGDLAQGGLIRFLFGIRIGRSTCRRAG